jgi:NAD-dependent DNA ligase
MTLLIALLVGLVFALGAGTIPVWAQTQAPPAAKKAPVDINSASAAELKAVKGIGEVDAKKIVENRPYKSTDELVQKKVMSKAPTTRSRTRSSPSRNCHHDRPARESAALPSSLDSMPGGVDETQRLGDRD